MAISMADCSENEGLAVFVFSFVAINAGECLVSCCTSRFASISLCIFQAAKLGRGAVGADKQAWESSDFPVVCEVRRR